MYQVPINTAELPIMNHPPSGLDPVRLDQFEEVNQISSSRVRPSNMRNGYGHQDLSSRHADYGYYWGEIYWR